MKYKAYHDKHEKAIEDVITLLDEHPMIPKNDFLTAKIMHAVNGQDHAAKKKHKPFSFEMKLAGSLICSGVLILVNNVIAIGQGLYFNEEVMKTIDSLGNMLSSAINQLGR